MVAVPPCTPSTSPPAAAIHILALGDSYTVGEAVPSDSSWPVRLAAALRAAGLAIGAPRIVARTGWTTDELSAGVDAARLDQRFDLVTLLVGVNDQYRGRSPADFAPRFRRLVERAVACADHRADRVIVVSIPDWGTTPFADGRDRARIAAEIDAFNAVVGTEAKRAGVRFANVTPISRRAAREPDLVANDGLHPSGRQYAAWLEVILPLAVAALRPGT